MATSEATETDHYDLPGGSSDFRSEVLRGLNSSPRWLPTRFLFDSAGCELHAMVSRQPGYYLPDAEGEIYGYFGAEIAKALGPGALLVLWGLASKENVFSLLDNMEEPAGFVGVVQSREAIQPLVDAVADRYPTLRPVCVSSDKAEMEELPESVAAISEKRVVFCPGGTIGDCERDDALKLLGSFRNVVGASGKILVGVDLEKPAEAVEAAYRDKAQIIDRLHLNLLQRANRELGTDFDLMKFRYEARFDRERGCVEMFVVSMASQEVTLDGQKFSLANNERIRTQVAYKYSQEQFQALAHEAGAAAVQLWVDSAHRFSTYLLESS